MDTTGLEFSLKVLNENFKKSNMTKEPQKIPIYVKGNLF